MKEMLAAVVSEDENGNFALAFHLDDQTQLASRLDQLLGALVQARAGMQPPVKQEPPTLGEVQPILSSTWKADPLAGGDMLLSLHHPSLGWVSWGFRKAMAQDLALGLAAVVGQLTPPVGPMQ